MPLIYPFAFLKGGKVQSSVVFAGGTLFGNGGTFGGNSAAIDGNISQVKTASSCSGANNTILYLGYTFPASHVWSGFKAWGSSDQGFIDAESNSITINCRVSNGSAPTDTTTAQSNGSSLGSVTFTDTSDNTVRQNLAISNATGYTSIWIIVPASTGANLTMCAEMLFYEDL